MKNKIIATFLLISALIGCKAQKTQIRELGNFDKIKISGALNMEFTSSDTSEVSITANENDLDKVISRVENATLIIYTKGNIKTLVRVNVKNKQLYKIDASGATDFKNTNILKNDSLEIVGSGASNIKLRVESNKLNCSVEGAATVKLDGTTNHLNADLTGASNLKAYDLVARSANIEASGASSAKINVTEKLNSSATGASDVKIKGDPKEVSAESSAAASISKSKESAKKSDSDCDTTHYNWKNKKITVYSCPDGKSVHTSNSKDGFKHWAGFSLASSGYFNGNGGTNMTSANKYMELDYGKSFNYQFNLFENQINLAGNRFKLISGFGFDYHSYAFANKTNLDPDASNITGTIDTSDAYSLKKNKFRMTYIQVPLLLEYNSSNNPAKTFHIAAGVIGQFLISSRTKQVVKIDGNEVTNVRKDSYNLTPFAVKAHVNFGYNNWTFFAEYNLSPLFQRGKGPELYPFTAGIRLIPFNVI